MAHSPVANTYKVVVIGDAGVGKTCISLRFATNKFPEDVSATCGAAFLVQSVCVNATPVKLQIWDTAGQERYESLISMYYRSAKAAVIVYDITDRSTFTKASQWIQKIKDEVPSLKVITLVGNKIDLGIKRDVKVEEGVNLAKVLEVDFMETSAKGDINVRELFVGVATKLVRKKISTTQQSGVVPSPPSREAPKSGRNNCCV